MCSCVTRVRLVVARQENKRRQFWIFDSHDRLPQFIVASSKVQEALEGRRRFAQRERICSMFTGGQWSLHGPIRNGLNTRVDAS
jgi:hypothetical protein